MVFEADRVEMKNGIKVSPKREKRQQQQQTE